MIELREIASTMMRHRVLSQLRNFSNPVRHPVLTLEQLYCRLLKLPGQSPREILMFKSLLSSRPARPLRVFEWGMGYSTVYYSTYLRSIGRAFEWHAVDNSREWFERVGAQVRLSGLDQQVRLACEEFPAFWMLPGYSLRRPACLASYPDADPIRRYIAHPKTLGIPFDIVIVDGRFRRRCLHEARTIVAPDGLVLLHDAQRAHYHEALAAYPSGRFISGGRIPGSLIHCQTWVGSVGQALETLLAPFSPSSSTIGAELPGADLAATKG